MKQKMRTWIQRAITLLVLTSVASCSDAGLGETRSALQAESAGSIQGWIDSISHNADDSNTISGWACSVGYPVSIEVHLYGYGPAGSAGSSFITALEANQANEEAVDSICGTSGVGHRFNFTIDALTVDKFENAAVWAYGINPSGQGNGSLSGSGRWYLQNSGAGSGGGTGGGGGGGCKKQTCIPGSCGEFDDGCGGNLNCKCDPGESCQNSICTQPCANGGESCSTIPCCTGPGVNLTCFYGTCRGY
jgi:hypothetical protein